jgi:hypothetical protein
MITNKRTIERRESNRKVIRHDDCTRGLTFEEFTFPLRSPLRMCLFQPFPSLKWLQRPVELASLSQGH